MVDGAALLMTMFYGMPPSGFWKDGARGANVLDGGAPFYDIYETATASTSRSARSSRSSTPSCSTARARRRAAATQHDRAAWPELRERFAATFTQRTRDEWAAIFEGSDACFAPVLTIAERAGNRTRRRAAARRVGGVAQPAPAPRFSRTPGLDRRGAPERGEGGRAALADWGFDGAEITAFERRGMGPGNEPPRRLIGRSGADESDQSPSVSTARPSSRSLSRCAVSERTAIGCRRGGTSA